MRNDGFHRGVLRSVFSPKSWNFFLKTSFALALSSGERVAVPPPPEHPGTDHPRTPARHASITSPAQLRGNRLAEDIQNDSSSRGQEELAALSGDDSVAGP